jgi:hypothetical protein
LARGPRTHVGLAAAIAIVAAACTTPDRGERGRRLFHGEVPLRAAIVGHDERLPTDAARCANCHENAPTPRAGDAALETLGPALDRVSLTSLAPRRGGPPSSYDQRSFCRVLAEGIDPAHVMIPQTMPRYAMTNDECEALWTFLTAR